MSYGSDTSELDPACRTVSAGQSLARVPSTQDTDTATDWVVLTSPSPGEPGVAATSTPSATNTATPTPCYPFSHSDADRITERQPNRLSNTHSYKHCLDNIDINPYCQPVADQFTHCVPEIAVERSVL